MPSDPPRKEPPARPDATILGVGEVDDTLRESEGLGETLPPLDIDAEVLGKERTLLGPGAAHETLTATPPSVELGTTGAALTTLPRSASSGPADGSPDFAPRARYQAQRRLGEGAMGTVELAKDNDIDRQVAIKWLKASPGDSGMVMRFADEVRLIGQLEHPNIVPIHDVGRGEDGRYYFVMKYAQGETLEKIISRLAAGDPNYHAKYSFEYRTKIFSELLRALEFTHERGIVHRDIKPANIMVGPFGEVTLMDWGVAKQLSAPEAEPSDLAATLTPDELAAAETDSRLSTTSRHEIIGTPLYMAPEQTHPGADLDQRADIYSLCVVFYELLTLRLPVGRKSSIAGMLEAVRTEHPKHAALVRSPHQPPVPADLGHFVAKGLAKDPAARYQTVHEMRRLLKRRDEGYVAVQCPMTFTKRVLHGMLHVVDRHPLLTMMLLMSALSAAGFGIYRLITLLG